MLATSLAQHFPTSVFIQEQRRESKPLLQTIKDDKSQATADSGQIGAKFSTNEADAISSNQYLKEFQGQLLQWPGLKPYLWCCLIADLLWKCGYVGDSPNTSKAFQIWNATEMWEKLRGKRLMFVGDSLNRGQWIAMLCLLQSVIPAEKRSITPNAPLTICRAEEYNDTVEFQWAPLVVESNSDDPINHRLDVHIQFAGTRLNGSTRIY